jgi:hypothetical protein
MPGLRMLAQKRAGAKALLLVRKKVNPRKVLDKSQPPRMEKSQPPRMVKSQPPRKVQPPRIKRPEKLQPKDLEKSHQVHVMILRRRMLKLEEFSLKIKNQQQTSQQPKMVRNQQQTSQQQTSQQQTSQQQTSQQQTSQQPKMVRNQQQTSQQPKMVRNQEQPKKQTKNLLDKEINQELPQPRMEVKRKLIHIPLQ